MKRILLSFSFITLLHLGNSYGQYYIQEAQLLVRFIDLYETDSSIIKTLDFHTITEWKTSSSGGTAGAGTSALPGNLFNQPPAPNDSAHTTNDNGRLANIYEEEFRKECNYLIEFARQHNNVFEGNELNKKLEGFPASFDYLRPIVEYTEHEQGVAGGTSAVGISSFLGVSQAEILKGVADWAIGRAQEELMKAFLAEWLKSIESDSVLQLMFPNTLNMLKTSDLGTIFTDGDTWKATFQQDFEQIYKKVPELANTALNQAHNPIDPAAKQELIVGLEVIVTLFDQLGLGKNADEILLLLGEESYLKLKTDVSTATIHRAILTTDVFLKSIRTLSPTSVEGYATPKEILGLSQEEVEVLWCLIYMREREKLKLAFNLKTEKEESSFYQEVMDHIGNFKLDLSKLSDNITGIGRLIKDNKHQPLTMEQFHTYTTLTFDLVVNGLTLISKLGLKTPDAKILEYKNKYMKGYGHVCLIQEGIKTKSYGKAALNTVNLLLWLKDCTSQTQKPDSGIYTPSGSLLATLPDKIEKTKDLVGKLSEQISGFTKKLPETDKIMKTKLAEFEEKIKKMMPLTKTEVLATIREVFVFSDDETRTIAIELASQITQSSEKVNKYAKLMAGVILAEDSDDIKNLLNQAALKTGGYIIKQKSAFSASVTFYPGYEYGWESLSKSGQLFPGEVEGQQLKAVEGQYMGAALPIGIEFAVGTNLRPIGAVGIYAQLLDLGAMLNYSLTNQNDSVSTLPEVGFQQVFSPGTYFMIHFANNPITLGAGISYSPNLREISNGAAVINANAIQYGAFLAVDLNVFPIYASKKKYTSKSGSKKSMGDAYGKSKK